MNDMNDGYSGWSMSKNAANAYEGGEMPKSKWTKAAMTEAVKTYCDDNDLAYNDNFEHMTKADIFDGFFRYAGWHHTSMLCNETDFFALDGGAVDRYFAPMTLEQLHARDIARQSEMQARDDRHRVEADRRNRHDAYAASHGFRPDTVAAYMLNHPASCVTGTSRRGTPIVTVTYDGKTTTYDARRADRTTLYGYDATTEDKK